MAQLAISITVSGWTSGWAGSNFVATVPSGTTDSFSVPLLLTVLGFHLLGIGVGLFVMSGLVGRSIRRARTESRMILQTAKAEGEARARELELDAEKRMSERRTSIDREVSESLAEVKASQARALKREETLDRKLESINQREGKLEQREVRTKALEDQAAAAVRTAESTRDQMKSKLAEVAGLSLESARELFLAEVRVESEHDANALSQKILDEAERCARDRAREITLMSIQRYAAENVADSTVRSIKIPSDDMKGRIIGREGRNIRAIERATGVDILVDDTPGVISVSCFDRVRQAIAAEALQKLVADGRVHPSRVEEIVEQTKRDIHERINKYGNDAVIEANIRGLHPKIIEAMGKLHFRTSYGQNVLRHSIEVAFLSQMIADQLGLNGQIARRAGFLHDIGKAMDHEMEGGHPAIGMEFARKFGEKSDPVLNAIGGHHADIPATTPYTPIVMAADAISGARPGARRESMEMYIKRLEQLEAIAKQHPAIIEAYAIQAGREVRVIVDAGKADDVETFAIAKSIAERVEQEMTFPGEIKVTVLREIRAEAVAR
ncbi:MAG: ribonuclease Y [Phycisphaerae bacterium]|nr:ribonuclease Y [Phycisphaerae bacterium]